MIPQLARPDQVETMVDVKKWGNDLITSLNKVLDNPFNIFYAPGATGEIIEDSMVGSASVSKLTAGTITSKAITLAVAATTGDVKIQAGRTDFGQTTAGFILGIDDSDSDRAKFEIGNATNYMNWNGLTLSIAGAITLTSGAVDFAYVTGATKPANNATVGADWSTNLSNIPTTLTTPSATGLYLSSTYMGYYVGAPTSTWTVFIKNDGTFGFKSALTGNRLEYNNDALKAYTGTTQRVNIANDGTFWFGAASGANSIVWNGSTLTLNGSLAVSNLTAGTITSQAITLAIAAGTGDVKIQAGKTDFGDNTAGFILGMDDSDSDKPKFEIGDATKYMKWDGAALTIRGTLNADDITAGSLSVDRITAGSIVTTKIANNAVTDAVSAYTADSITVGHGVGYVTVQSCAVTRVGTPVLINISLTITTSAGAGPASLQLLRGVTSIFAIGSINTPTGQANLTNFSYLDTDTGTGATTYYVQVATSDGTNDMQALYRSLSLLSVKK